MGADFVELYILLVVAPVQIFSCLINVYAGLMAFLFGRVVASALAM